MATRLLLASSPHGVLIEREGSLYQRFAGWPDRPLRYQGPHEPFLRTLKDQGWLLRVVGPDGRDGPELADDRGAIPDLRAVKLATGELVFQVQAS